MFPFPTDPLEFAKWLSTPAALAVIVSLLFERQAWFQALSGQARANLVLAAALVIPFLAVAAQWGFGLGVIFPEDPKGWALWAFGLLFQGLISWGASQYGHQSDPEKSRLKLGQLLK